jgi:hypothetical protein
VSSDRPGRAGPDDDDDRSLPTTLRTAALVAAVEALGLLVLAVAVVVQAARGDRASVSQALLLAALAVLWALALAWCARGLLRVRRWARSPVVLSQLLLLAVGVPLVQGPSGRWAGVLILVASVVGLLAALAPASTAALEHRSL